MSGNSSNIDQQFSSERETIHVVQHLIEKCLLFYMDRNECVACLQKHANVKPALTRIVWDELEKSNIQFFAAYATRRLELEQERRAAHYMQNTASSSSFKGKENQQQACFNPNVLGPPLKD